MTFNWLLSCARKGRLYCSICLLEKGSQKWKINPEIISSLYLSFDLSFTVGLDRSGKKNYPFSRGNVFGFHSCSVNGCEFASNGSYAIQILYEQEHLEHNCKLFRNGFEQYIKHIAKYKCLVGRRKRRKVFQDSIYALMSKSIQSPTLSSLQLEDCLIFGVGIESLIDSYSENWKASDVWSSCCSFV